MLRVLAWSVLAPALAAMGCSSPTRAPGGPDVVKENLTQIFNAYQLAEKSLNHPPRGAQELTPFLAKVGSSADVLQSPGDRQPFVIIWGASTGPKGMPPRKTEVDPNKPEYPPILAYEKAGTANGRHVLFVMGPQTILDEARFQQATFANNHRPQ
jgi:hypothetical protein